MRKAIVVGSGAGGATAARELQGRFEVTLLERGGEFRPFSMGLAVVEKLKRARLLRDEREISLIFPPMRVRRCSGPMVLVNGEALGGTTTLATGNAVRADGGLRALGIGLDREFEELHREIPVSADHRRQWRPATRRLFEAFAEANLAPTPLPKMGDNRLCTNCGRCVLGCRSGAKWDSRRFLEEARAGGARVVTRAPVRRVVTRGSRAVGVEVRRGWRSEFLQADLVVLAAGGFGTPPILENSGVSCRERLFVDPVLCVAAPFPGALQNREISMPFVAQRDGYILSPYFDFLSYFFNRKWTHPAGDTLGIMVKLADAGSGSVANRKIDKRLTARDHETLRRGVDECLAVFERLGVDREKTFLGTLNAGHPGGMLPLTAAEAVSLRPPGLPDSLLLADATLFPASLGNPPMLTIMALAKKVCATC